MLLITLTTALFCSASVTVSQHETEAAEWHSATIDLIAYTCGNLAVTGQNVLQSSYSNCLLNAALKT